MSFESDEVGLEFKSRMPKFSSDASIQEAISVYHYGVNEYTSQDIPDESIEGHFRSLRDRILANETSILSLGETYVQKTSVDETPNTVYTESATVVPLTIKGFLNHQVSLQKWINSSNSTVAAVFPNGSASFKGNVSVGSQNESTTIALKIEPIDSSHIGILVSAKALQTANLQEWKNPAGVTISWVDKDAKLFSSSITDLENGLQTKFPLNVLTKAPTASYTLLLSDAQKIVEMNVSTANTLTVPPDTGTGGVAFPIGTSILVVQTGTGQTTITAAAGVTINSYIGLKIIGRWAGCTLIKRAENSWVAIGGLVT